MKRTIALVLSVLMVVAVLAGCSDNTSTTNDNGNDTANTQLTAPDTTVTSDSEEAHSDANSISDLVMYATSDTETYCTFYTENAASNFLDTLSDCWLGKDPTGEITYLLADDYSANEDSSVWTFHLREGVTWVDNQLNYKADVTVYDFLTAAEYVLNYWKNDGVCASMLQNSVKGATEYYEYTKTLDEAEAYALTYEGVFSEMVGIVADASANTVTYTCKQPTPYFWSIATHKSTSPLSQAIVDEIGAENYKAVRWDQLWSCGGYVMTECVQNNATVLSKNTEYWNYDNVSLFDTVTIKIIESTDTGYQLYTSGEIDSIQLGESTLVNILSDSSNPYHDYVTKAYSSIATYVMHFNYAKNNEDGTPDTNWNTAIANENFRMAMYWGLELGSYYSRTDPVTPYSIAGYTFTQNNFVNIGGVDYQDYVIDLLGLEKSNDYDSRYDATLAQEYLDKAVEELTEAGVTFPIEIDHYIASGNQTALDTATVLKAAFDNLFGDYIDFQIKTYISSFTKEAINYGYQSWVISAWTADYDDPSNVIEQMSLTNDHNAYLDYSNVQKLTSGEVYDLFQEFTQMCNDASAITGDLEARYKAYAEAEAFMIEHNLAMPMSMNVKWQLTRVNDYTRALRGQSYQNWESNSEGYTTADYNTFAAERAAE